MPPAVLDADQTEAAMTAGSSELKFLLCKEQVTALTQARLFHAGITSSALLGSIAENVTDFKAMLKDEFGVDPAASMAGRLETARMLLVFNSAVVRTEKKVEMDGTGIEAPSQAVVEDGVSLDGRGLGNPLVGSRGQ